MLRNKSALQTRLRISATGPEYSQRPIAMTLKVMISWTQMPIRVLLIERASCYMADWLVSDYVRLPLLALPE
jgi:hypothetical protein